MKRGERMRERETFHLEVPADENNLSEVRDFIAGICDRAGFSKGETNNTKLAVDEACTNIIKHAYKEKAGDIRIDVQAGPGTVEISIFDRGEPFDWSKVKEPDLDHYVEIGKKGGLGIYLMNRLMDNLSYSASPTGNRLYMVKNSAAAAARPQLFGSIRRPKWTSTLRFKFALRTTLGLFGLVVFLWAILLYRQTNELRDRFADTWLQRKRVAETIASLSVGALTKDPYDVSGLELSTDAIPRQIKRYPEVKYIRVVHADGRIFASNQQDEFLTTYAIPAEVRSLDRGAAYRTVAHDSLGLIREFHQAVYLTDSERGQTSEIGRVVVGISEAIATGDIIDPRPMMTLILVGVFAAGVALSYLLVAIFVRPIQALTDGVRAIGEGSLSDEIQITGPQEIGEIARAFNEITSKFREAQKNVVEQERLHKEMQVAQEIQQTLLPKRVPTIGGYDIASLYRAAKEVGGDYYDFVRVDDDTLGVVVADVSGKGVPGSLVMTMIRTALRMEARGNHSAAEVMARMNDFVTEDMKKGMFVTIFYSILDSKNRIISYASAGHNPMILYRAETDETYFLNPRGFPVGIKLPDDTLFRRSIDVEKIKLKKDDMLVIYTDGVTEAMNGARNQYGEERLIRLIKQCGRLAPQEFIDRLNDDIKSFTGDQPQNDDITVVAIKEKLQADEVLYGIRRKLLDLVEVQGVAVAEACRMMRVSPSTYYRYKKRLEELGERGLQDKTLRREVDIRRVSIEQRKGLLGIIRDHPRYGAKKITAAFNEGKAEGDLLSPAIVYDELKRIRLNTYEMRLEYLRRNRFISDEEFKKLVAAHGRPAEAAAEAAGAPQAPAEAAPEEAAPASVPEARPAAAAPSLRRESAPPLRRRGARESFGTGQGRAIEVTSEELAGDVVVLHVAGHLDSSSAGELEGILESVHEYGYRKIIVDLAGVMYISSGGWGIFTGRVKSLREGEGDVVLASMSPEVYDIYELLGFQEIILQFATVDEAAAYISLPLAERRSRLERESARPAPLRTLETRQSTAASGASGPGEVPETDSSWAALKIEAGTVGDQGEITVLYLDGVVDTVSCVNLRSVLDGLVDRGAVKIVIDMSRVEYVSSSGWGVFASRIKDIRLRGGDLKIFGMDQEVDGIYSLLGFDSIMRSFGVLAEAIEDFKNEAPTLADGEILDEEPPDEAAAAPRAERTEGAGTPLAIASAGDARAVGGTVVVTIDGAVDSSTAEAFEAELSRRADERPLNLILDVERMVYISSGGWGIIIRYLQKLGETGGRIAIAGMSSSILNIFRDLGFEPLIPHYGTLEMALAELAPAKGAADFAPPEAAPGPGAPAGAPAPEPEDRKQDLADALLGASKIAPLEPLERVADPEKVIFIDFKKRTDVREDKDKRITRIGWDEYGKRLRNSDRKPRGKK